MFGKIALLDMDSYFASIECAKNPKLKNYPIAVVGNGEKTVITSANYKAKSFGVKTGMNLSEAKKICPNIIFVKADFSYYEFTTLKIVNIIDKYFPIYKEASIDEFYIALDNINSPMQRLKDLKDEIYEKLSLTCTIGIGKNPIIAKTACEYAKPNGFFVVDDFDDFSEKVHISLVPGIGSGSMKILKEYNIETLKEFLSNNNLPNSFDKLKYLILKDYTEPEFFKVNLPKSIGHYLTMDKKLESLEEVLEIGKYLLFGLYSKLVRHKMGAKSLAVYLKDSVGNFSISKSLGLYSNDYLVFSKVVEELYKSLYSGRPVSKIGLSLNNLRLLNYFQESLFWNEELKRFERLININDTFFAGFFVLKQKKVARF